MDCCSNNSLTDLCFSYMKPQGRNGKEREVTHTHRLGLFVTALSCGQLSNLFEHIKHIFISFFHFLLFNIYSHFVPLQFNGTDMNKRSHDILLVS